MKVVKFGGSSMADAGQYRKVRDILMADPERKVVIVSAAGTGKPIVPAEQGTAKLYTDRTGKPLLQTRKILPMCIAFDHRAMDFGDIVPFMERTEAIFKNPSVIYDWLDKSILGTFQLLKNA